MPKRLSRFASTLKKARTARGLSMRDMARKLDISPVYYSDVENDIKPPFPPNGKVDYVKLSELLGVDRLKLEELSGRKDDEGVRELREIIVAAKEMLFERLSAEDQSSYMARSDRGGPEDLIWICEQITGRPAPRMGADA